MSNRLADATSPYLRQHRDNPVHWYQWGDDAFEEARRTGRPILLSVGYSACHWCHVMAHESFEDEATASVMNSLFINVKVDREERPDVDAVYMDAVQALTGRGGWPMTVFLTPDGEPFYGGTYYPRETFVKLMNAVDDAWTNRRDELQQNVDALVESIGRTALIEPADDIDTPRLVSSTVDALRQNFDSTWGGFGGAPKFPSTFALDLLMRIYSVNKDATLLPLVRTSLDAMAAGGMYDHLGGGFSRYSVDNQWLVPHFEKMLYDQALLVRVYLHSWQLTGEPRFLQTLEETIEYVLRDLRHPLGGFYSAEDADSEGVEGKFYVWSISEIREICGDDADAVIEWFGVTEHGNWEHTNILERVVRGDLARPDAVERGRVALLAVRDKRIRPGLDDKVLAEWNALMLSTIAEAAAATGSSKWLDAAVTNANFLCDNLRVNGRWMRSWQGEARVLAFSADYGALVDAFVRVHEATGDPRWLDEAAATADALIELFSDPEDIGVYTNGTDGDQLVARPKELMDNATACSNSLAAVGLLRLAALTGNERHREFATAIVDRLAEAAARLPLGFGHLLLAAELRVLGIEEIVISGDRPDLVAEAQRRWLPRSVLTWGNPGSSPLWEGRNEQGSEGRAYVCRQMVCAAPASTVEELDERLNALG